MIALISIMVRQDDGAQQVNALLHEYRDMILGRMGLPLKEHRLNVISVVADAEQTEINALAGRLGRIDGVTAKALYRK